MKEFILSKFAVALVFIASSLFDMITVICIATFPYLLAVYGSIASPIPTNLFTMGATIASVVDGPSGFLGTIRRRHSG